MLLGRGRWVGRRAGLAPHFGLGRLEGPCCKVTPEGLTRGHTKTGPWVTPKKLRISTLKCSLHCKPENMENLGLKYYFK